MEKHNPLTTPYPKFDKVLALVRKGMIINETTELEINWQLYDDFADMYVYSTKKTNEYIFTASIKGYNNVDDISLIKYVFNYILKKGSLPKEIPTFDYTEQLLNRTTNLIKKLKK